MNRTVRTGCTMGMLVLVGLLGGGSVGAQTPVEMEFQKGYFLQTRGGDLEQAIAAFEKVVADPAAPDVMRSEAKARLAACQEDLIARDLSRLMPASALAYAEFNSPGRHLAFLMTIGGVVRDPSVVNADRRRTTIRLAGLFLPNDFVISPAMLNELQQIRAIAVSLPLAEVDGQRKLVPLIAIHPGDSQILRGMLEAGVQFFDRAEPIAGFPCYRLANWTILLSNRLVLASPNRELVADALGRLQASSNSSLATTPDFQKCSADRDQALIYVHLRPYRVAAAGLGQIGGTPVRERFELIESLAVGIRETADGIEGFAHVDWVPTFRSEVWDIFRTSPITKRTLHFVPHQALAFGTAGINPVRTAPTGSVGEGEPDLLEILQELWEGIEEVTVFVIPVERADGSRTVAVAVLVANNDTARTEQIWSQALTVSAVLSGPTARSPNEVMVEGRTGKEYQLSNLPPVALVRVDGFGLLVGMRDAVSASLKAADSKVSVLTDDSFRPLIERQPATASKLMVVHLGRLFGIVPIWNKPEELETRAAVATLLEKTLASIVSEESETELVVRFDVSGMPNLADFLQYLSRLVQ